MLGPPVAKCFTDQVGSEFCKLGLKWLFIVNGPTARHLSPHFFRKFADAIGSRRRLRTFASNLSILSSLT